MLLQKKLLRPGYGILQSLSSRIPLSYRFCSRFRMSRPACDAGFFSRPVSGAGFTPGPFFVFLFAFFITSAPLAPGLQARDLTDALGSYIPSLMEDQNIQGVQVHVFRPGRTYTESFGLAASDIGFGSSEKDTPLTDDTAFAVGALRGPLSAYAALKHLQENGQPFDSDIKLPSGETVTADQLLLMTAGLQSTHEGLLSPGMEKSVSEIRDELLEETVNQSIPAATHYVYAPQGFQWLFRSLSLDPNETVRRTVLAPFKLNNTFFYAEKENRPVAQGYEPRGKTPAPIDLPQVAFDAYLDLLTTAGDYGAFLSELTRQARAGDPVASYILSRKWNTALPGGRSPGLYFHKLCGPHGPGFYRILSQYPGFAPGAVFTKDGRGAVVLLNARQQIVLQRILDRIIQDLYPECRSFLEEKKPGYFPENVSPKSLDELTGYYRPRYLLSGAGEAFRFLADTHLDIDDRKVRFSGFFETDPSIYLVPIAPDLFLARGKAGMDGWMVQVVRNRDGEVVGLQSDLMYYDRVNVIFSIGGIVGFSVLGLVMLAIGMVWFFVRRRES